MTRKRIFFLVIIVLLLGGIVFRKPLASVCFQGYLKNFCQSSLGAKLNFESFSYENGRWILTKPVLSTSQSPSEGGFHLVAERADLDMSFSWLSRTFDL